MRAPSLSPRALAAAGLVALPWLNPAAVGPSPQVLPWLATAACALVLWLLAADRGLLAGLRFAWPGLALLAWACIAQGGLDPELVFLAAGLALVALGARCAADPRLAPGLQTGLLLAAAVSAVLGLVQYLGWAAPFSPWVNGAAAGTAFANLRQTNQYATLCWIGLAVLAFGTLPLRRSATLALAALLGVACAASVSRTGGLELLVLLALAGGWPGPDRRRRLLPCAVAAAAYLAGAFLLPLLLEALSGAEPGRQLWTRLGGGAGAGCASRLVLWSNVLQLVAQQPWTGWGWGELDYAHYATLYEGPRFCDILDNAHNLPLHLAVELGLPAALLACGGALLWAWRQRPWREDAPLRQLAWALLALVLLHSLLEYPLWYGPFQFACGLGLGWLARPSAAPAIVPPRLPRALAAATLLAGCAYAAWDYARVSQIYLLPEQRRAGWRDDTLAHARRSWLFQGQARFAEVTLAAPGRANAAWMYREAGRALHYSPESRVIERVIESAVALGRDREALLHLARYRAAFPRDYEAWRAARRQPLPG